MAAFMQALGFSAQTGGWESIKSKAAIDLTGDFLFRLTKQIV
jgi:hypothetical protein